MLRARPLECSRSGVERPSHSTTACSATFPRCSFHKKHAKSFYDLPQLWMGIVKRPDVRSLPVNREHLGLRVTDHVNIKKYLIRCRITFHLMRLQTSHNVSKKRIYLILFLNYFMKLRFFTHVESNVSSNYPKEEIHIEESSIGSTLSICDLWRFCR